MKTSQRAISSVLAVLLVAVFSALAISYTVVSNNNVLRETTGKKTIVADPDSPIEWAEAFNSLEDKALYHDQIEGGLKWTEKLRGHNGWHNH